MPNGTQSAHEEEEELNIHIMQVIWSPRNLCENPR